MSALDFISRGSQRLSVWYGSIDARRQGASPGDESGAALVEFTVLMPLFFLMLFGMIEWGLFFFYQNTMLSAAQSVSRAVAVDGYTTATQIKANTPLCASWLPKSLTSLSSFSMNVSVSSPPNPCSYPNPQSVTVAIQVNAAQALVVNYRNLFGGTLNGTASMHWEGLCQTATSFSVTCP